MPTEVGRTSWEEVVLKDDDIFAMQFPEGWLVGRSIQPELIPFNFQWPAIPGQQASGPNVNTVELDRPWDVNNNNASILYHEETKQLWQIFIGLDTPVTWFFLEYPLGSRHGYINPNIGKPTWTLNAVSRYGYKFGGWESFYGEETAASMFYLPFRVEVGMGIFNHASYAQQPQVRFLINKFNIQPFDPADKADASIITQVLRRQVRSVMWGPSTDGWSWNQDFRKIYDVDPVKILKGTVYRVTKTGEVALGG